MINIDSCLKLDLTLRESPRDYLTIRLDRLEAYYVISPSHKKGRA
jgi:hypothetical protein